MKAFKVCILAASFFLGQGLNAQQAATELPEFPARNVDTRTIQYIDGKLRTVLPHIPVFEYSIDGRIGLRGDRGNAVEFQLLRPEGVIGYLRDGRNSRVGANMLGPKYLELGAHSILSRTMDEDEYNYDNFSIGGSVLCERTWRQNNPYVCETNKDCYNLTLVTRLTREKSTNAGGRTIPAVSQLASVDMTVVVSDPKTMDARIERIDIQEDSVALGARMNFAFSAETTITGDQRLLVFRMGGNFAHKFNPERIGDPSEAPGDERKHNIVYMAYPVKDENNRNIAQCDVTRWTEIYPIAYAHHDTKNDMKNRYKFAKYPLRDSLGREYLPHEDIGGSYPWMDEDAANLFYTASGFDTFYNDSGSEIIGVYREAPSGPGYVTPNSVEQAILDAMNLDRKQAFESPGGTTALSVAGFWTHGKGVVLDGLLNNTDYDFEVSTNRLPEMTRKLALYSNAPEGQEFEPTGMSRDLGDNTRYNDYADGMHRNTDHMGSVENKFNYLPTLKPVTPKDVVWHVQNGRFSEEVVFDDFISPYVLINADMNPAVGAETDRTAISNITYDGIKAGVKATSSLSTFPAEMPNDHPLAFQNAATAPDEFMAVPRYGRPIGDLRVEPIAKGGIFGKGLWMTNTTGLQFKVPTQDSSSVQRLRIEDQQFWYVSVFLDLRDNGPSEQWYKRSLLQINGNKRIMLAKRSNGPDNEMVDFDHIEFVEGNAVIARLELTGALKFYKNSGWKHLAFQFLADNPAMVLIDGMMVGRMQPVGSATNEQISGFFRVESGTRLTLGAMDGGSAGIKAWVDEFKVIARYVEFNEERCNIARGTLVILPETYSGALRDKMGSYPEWARSVIANRHSLPSDSDIVCVTKYGAFHDGSLSSRLLGTQLSNLPAGATSLRDLELLDGHRLTYNQPRADYSANNFCLSCHVPVEQSPHRELNVQALVFLPDVNMQNDSRRQPSQPPRYIRGVIPANYFGPGLPANTLTNWDKHLVDRWISR